jgi:Zn-dependent protease
MLSLLSDPLQIVAMAIGLLLAVDIHECAHAWAANELGDPTARYQGRLSLNPLVHLDPMGTLMMLFSLFGGIGIGWGKPVPVNPWNLRHGRVGYGLVALAGPASNLILAAALALPLRLDWLGAGLFGGLLFALIRVNVSLALFNLLPIAPLDGGTVLVGILSAIRQPWAYDLVRVLEGIQSQAPMVFILLILADQALGGRILGVVLRGPYVFIMRSMLGI